MKHTENKEVKATIPLEKCMLFQLWLLKLGLIYVGCCVQTISPHERNDVQFSLKVERCLIIFDKGSVWGSFGSKKTLLQAASVFTPFFDRKYFVGFFYSGVCGKGFSTATTQ